VAGQEALREALLSSPSTGAISEEEIASISRWMAARTKGHVLNVNRNQPTADLRLRDPARFW
jgi:hypothetical protein